MKVPIVGGEWDGAYAFIPEIAPGSRLALHKTVYEVEWAEGAPRLVPVVCEP